MDAAKTSLRSKDGKLALDYLKDSRKFSDKVIDDFDIGYCPENTYHDLAGRIITPIYDIYGETVAISTRHLDKNHKMRFWHESFDKGSYLFGLHRAKEAIRKYNKVIIVEGEFDTIAYHSYGINMTVGCCGSALTLFQIAFLSRYCTDIYLMFDGDVAGRKSTKRIMEMKDRYSLDVYGLNFIPVYLPKDTDPDDFLFEVGAKGVANALKEAKYNSSDVKKEEALI